MSFIKQKQYVCIIFQATMFVLSSFADVYISEINPRATQQEPEWIELYNNNKTPINLKNWRFGTTRKISILCSTDCVLNSYCFIALTISKKKIASLYPYGLRAIQPKIWPPLHNYTDTLYLFSPHLKTPIDVSSYSYKNIQNWEKESLIRVTSSNKLFGWYRAQVKSPGLPNKNTDWLNKEKPSISIAPIPFSPDNDGYNDLLKITISKWINYSVTLNIYAVTGEKVHTIDNIDTESYYWDGKTQRGSTLPSGPFFIVAIFNNGTNTLTKKKAGILW